MELSEYYANRPSHHCSCTQAGLRPGLAWHWPGAVTAAYSFRLCYWVEPIKSFPEISKDQLMGSMFKWRRGYSAWFGALLFPLVNCALVLQRTGDF